MLTDLGSSLTLFCNTHSSAVDCWNMFLLQLNRHWPTHPSLVVAMDGPCRSGVGITYIDYSAAKKFSNQYLMGLCAVETPYVLTLQEDFILYADVDEAAIAKEIESLRRDSYYKCSRLIDSGRELQYSMQATIWETRWLRILYANMEADTPWDSEIAGNSLLQWPQSPPCRQRCDDHLPMRGRDHRDSPIFPYIATALVKGAWNSEYRPELEQLHREYGIDAQQRGWSA